MSSQSTPGKLTRNRRDKPTVILIGADIGGTFKDLFVIDRASGACMTGKILTDHTNPTNGIIDGLKSLAERDAVDLKSAERVFHGTTLVTNARAVRAPRL